MALLTLPKSVNLMCELYSLHFQIIGLYLLPPAIDCIYLFISFSSFSVTEPKTSFWLYRLLFSHNHSVCLNHPNNI